MADTAEQQFQQDIIDGLRADGWLVGAPGNYDRTNALYPEDLIAFVQEAHPDRWEKFAQNNPDNPERALISATVRQLDKHGTLDVLRHGFKVPGTRIDVCAFRPDHGMNPDAVARYQANRLRVVPEVSYSPHARSGEYNPRLDLVLFVNGIPTATLELKSEFKQSVEHAKQQYRHDRPPKDPQTRNQEPLLTFKRGALVHFAVSQDEVAMTTRLAGKETGFLPFNRGTEDGGAGNPAPADADTYATEYLWREVLHPDAWLRLIARFLHLEKKTEQDFHGRRTTKEGLIFPRYHQWDVVKKLLAATAAEGAGQRYLIQHSAGSGKSNSIAWVAHQLASLYDDAGEKLFNSVIVVTDRTVLDEQLQETIYQFEHAHGVVRPITSEGSGSKSQQLAEALMEQTRIVIVTIQTFPALFKALDERPQLANGRYAVIADEAHSSQTGASAGSLKKLLGVEHPDGEEVSAEALMDAAVEARQPTERISYYAFTATPKGKTLELFGRLPDPNRPKGSDNLPEPFHVYSMRQAIEEGFILDVLQNYTTYSTAWRLANAGGDDHEVDAKKASSRLARWVQLHPHNVGQKVEVIVEHFRSHVCHRLDGQAKAMVVTSSRQQAVRYAQQMRRFVEEHGHSEVRPLVAFSGSVGPDDQVPEEVTEQSSLLNPGLQGRDLREAFDTDDFNVMIVANKFQTGFDEPKLCAMYVDKRLQGVDCVQILSRLNRVFPGKTTFVLDFVNNTDDVLNAFLPYYNKAALQDTSDPQLVYDLQDKLDAAGIYHWDEVQSFAAAFFDPKANASQLSHHCRPARDRFRQRYQDAQERLRYWRNARQEAENKGDDSGLAKADHELGEAGEERDAQDRFKKDLRSFVRAYEFLSQIVAYEDTDLEKLCVFAKSLAPLLTVERLAEEELELGDVALTHYRLTKQKEHEINLREAEGDYRIRPVSEVGSGQARDPEHKQLSEILERLNELFGAEITDADKLQFANGVVDRLQRDEMAMAEYRTNSRDQLMHGRFPERVEQIVMDTMNDNQAMSLSVLDDADTARAFTQLILEVLAGREAGELAQARW